MLGLKGAELKVLEDRLDASDRDLQNQSEILAQERTDLERMRNVLNSVLEGNGGCMMVHGSLNVPAQLALASASQRLYEEEMIVERHRVQTDLEFANQQLTETQSTLEANESSLRMYELAAIDREQRQQEELDRLETASQASKSSKKSKAAEALDEQQKLIDAHQAEVAKIEAENLAEEIELGRARIKACALHIEYATAAKQFFEEYYDLGAKQRFFHEALENPPPFIEKEFQNYSRQKGSAEIPDPQKPGQGWEMDLLANSPMLQLTASVNARQKAEEQEQAKSAVHKEMLALGRDVISLQEAFKERAHASMLAKEAQWRLAVEEELVLQGKAALRREDPELPDGFEVEESDDDEAELTEEADLEAFFNKKKADRRVRQQQAVALKEEELEAYAQEVEVNREVDPEAGFRELNYAWRAIERRFQRCFHLREISKERATEAYWCYRKQLLRHAKRTNTHTACIGGAVCRRTHYPCDDMENYEDVNAKVFAAYI